jgi:hypothetical protein
MDTSHGKGSLQSHPTAILDVVGGPPKCPRRRDQMMGIVW